MYCARFTIIFMGVLSVSNARIVWKLSKYAFPLLACNNEDSDYTFNRGDIPDLNFTVTLTLKDCGITELSIGCFEGFPLLDSLDVSYNRIKTLRFGIFTGLSNLSTLDLSYNLITDLPGDVFDNIPILEELYLTGNHLTNLNSEALKRAHWLWLSNNTFSGSNLDRKSFHSRELWSLNLDHNNMEGAPDDMFENTPNLTWLSLTNCSIAAIPKYIRTLSPLSLYLDNNKIHDISELAHLFTLYTLGLSNNLIEKIEENAFVTMTNLTVLDLSGNRIQAVTVDLFRGLLNLITVDLSSNRITYLEDNFLKKMKNSGVSLQYFGIDNNPWQCACLKDLLHEAFSLGIVYNSKRYDGTHILCVTHVKFACNRNSNENYLSMYKEITNDQEHNI